MPRVPLQGESLDKLSAGFVGKLVDKALREIFADIHDRGDEDKLVRKMTIELAFKPEGGGFVKVLPKVTTKLPSLVPPETRARMDMAVGGLVFNPESPDNPDQKTFADKVDAKTGEILD